MSLIYITGISGSGKSEVRRELARRGYDTREVDDGLAAFYDNSTKERVKRPMDSSLRTEEWRSKHTWKIAREVLEKLADQAGDNFIFVCGTASNDKDLLDLFSNVVALTLDKKTLVHRIKTRTTGDFGKSPHELATIMKWQEYAAAEYKDMGAKLVNSTQPLNEVVDQVLALTTSK